MKKLSILLASCIISMYATSQTNNSSVSFDGTNDYISIPNNGVLNPTNAITIQAWIKADSWTPDILLNSNYIVGKDEWSTTPITGYSLRSGGNGKLSFNFASGVTWHPLVSASIMSTNSWYYVTGTYDGTQIKIYINGISVGSQFFSGNINPCTESLNMGRTPYLGSSTPRLFDGKIDQVEIWNIALDSVQINQYMLCSPIGNEAGLVGFWNFEEGVGTSTADKTMYGNNGQLINGTTWSTDIQPICLTTSTLDNSPNINLTEIYPNPAFNLLNVKVNKDFKIQKIEIYSVTGQKIELQSIDKNENLIKIDISNLSEGLYFLKVYDKDKIMGTSKFFKM